MRVIYVLKKQNDFAYLKIVNLTDVKTKHVVEACGGYAYIHLLNCKAVNNHPKSNYLD